MSLCNKILILGGGVSAERFVLSFWFDETKSLTICGFDVLGKSKELAKKYGLHYIDYSKLTKDFINTFDLIVFSLPVDVKLKYLFDIVVNKDYSNYVILEKPLAVNEVQIASYIDLLSKLKGFNVAYSINFLSGYELQNKNCEYIMDYGTAICDINFNIKNNLPHIINLLYKNFGVYPQDLQIIGDFSLGGKLGDNKLSITFVKDKEAFDCNNVSYPKVNFMLANNNMINSFETVSTHNFEIDLNIAKIINNLIGVKNEKF